MYKILNESAREIMKKKGRKKEVNSSKRVKLPNLGTSKMFALI